MSIKPIITWCINSTFNKTVVLLMTLVSFLLAVYLLPLEIVKAKMLPGKDSNTFTIYVDLKSGSSIFQTKKVTDKIVRILQKEEEILDIEVFLGTPSALDFAGLVKGSALKSGENFAEIVVNILKKHDRTEPSYLMVQRLRPLLNSAVSKINKEVVIKMVEPPAGPPVMADIVAEVYGTNFESMQRLAHRVQKVLSETKGLVDTDLLNDETFERYTLVLNYDKIKRLGLETQAVSSLIETAFNGQVITTKNMKNSSTQVDVFMRLKQRSMNLNSALASLKIKSSNNKLISLSEIVNVKKVLNDKTRYSKNLQDVIHVVATTDMVSQIYPLLDARTHFLEAFSNEYEVKTSNLLNLEFIEKSSGEKLKLVWDGELKVTLDTFRDLGGAFIAALVLIFLLMVLYYKNFALSGIVLLASFLSIIGVIFGHLIMDLFTQTTFFLTATSLIGFIALIGISSRNSLLLIDFTKQLMSEGKDKKEAIIEAATIRSKPIFLTAMAIILASTLLASDAVFGGLGVSLIFGTISAVIASLFVVPVLLDNLAEQKLC